MQNASKSQSLAGCGKYYNVVLLDLHEVLLVKPGGRCRGLAGAYREKIGEKTNCFKMSEFCEKINDKIKHFVVE